MKFYKLYLITFFTIIYVINTIESKKVTRDVSFLENKDKTNSFQCKYPQPRSLSMYSFDHIKTQSKTFKPDFVVLHRCHIDAGCCVNNARTSGCFPINEENVTIQFKVMIGNSNIYKVEEYEFKNHTQCGCQKFEDQVK